MKSKKHNSVNLPYCFSGVHPPDETEHVLLNTVCTITAMEIEKYEIQRRNIEGMGDR